MFRILLLVSAIAFSSLPAIADRFMGRTFEITDGRRDLTKSAPLIVAMHGFLGNGSNMQQKTRFDALAKQDGFVVVYPNGIRRRWNDGRSARNKTDDVGYIAALINTLAASGTVDPRRVFLTGHSNGGGMAMRMACDRPDLIGGIAVIATKSPTSYQCGQGRPVPALFVHGTEDPIAPNEGRPEGSRLGGALSSDATIELWKRRNRCKGSAQVRTIDRKNDGTSAKISQFSRCAAPLTLVLIQGHGHDWPNGIGKATRLQGPATKEVDASQLTWKFFENL